MEKACYLIDLERSVASGVVHYWKANKMGYTTNLKEAGSYDEEVAANIVDSDFNRLTVKISEKKANELAMIDNLDPVVKAGLAFQQWKDNQK